MNKSKKAKKVIEVIEKRIGKYTRLYDIAIDDYCSYSGSNSLTRSGLNRMNRYSRKIKKLNIKLSEKTLDRFLKS